MLIHSFLFAFAATALLLLPGFALLRICAPRLDLVSRITLAPGVTIAVTTLLFTWSEFFFFPLGPPLPWILMVFALLGFVIRKPRRVRWRREHLLGSATLIGLVLLHLTVRFYSTRDWIVPSGIDSAQHSVIVQLMLDHNGLFQSWAPYNDAETFTYHFGFHAITALFAWMTGVDAFFAVSIMACVIGACAIASLFGLVQLWTRNIWGGVFAVAFWELYSQHLYFFYLPGRWTLLTGIAILSSALALLVMLLSRRREKRIWPLQLLCGLNVAGLIPAQYKTALIFLILAAALVCSRCVIAFFSRDIPHLKYLRQLSLRALGVAAFALLFSAPKLNSVLRAKTGQILQHVVLEAPRPNPAAFGAPVLNHAGLVHTGFNVPQKIVVSALALIGVLLVLLRRRRALWYLAGWGMITLVMNPKLIGINRTGVIDEIHWKYAVQTAIAAMAGLTMGFICEWIRKPGSWSRNTALMLTAFSLAGWGAISSSALPQSSRYVLPDDVRLMSWIRQNVPPNEKIAARSFFYLGQVQGLDAAVWLPYFTRHQTNQIPLASSLERAPADAREKVRTFTRELYTRDMSTPDSAQWMGRSGFRWFYVGALFPEKDAQRLEQMSRNPSIHLAHLEGDARLYRVD